MKTKHCESKEILLNATRYNLILSVSVIVKLLRGIPYRVRSLGGRYVIWEASCTKIIPTSDPFFLIGPIARSVKCLLYETTLPNGMFFLEQNPSSTDLRKSKLLLMKEFTCKHVAS